MVDVHLRTALERPPSVPTGVTTVRFPTAPLDFEGEIGRALVAAGMVDDPFPLETLHERVKADFRRAMPAITGTPTMRSAPGLGRAYLDLVSYLAREVLGFDVVFQDNPSLRFHFPLPMTDGFRSADGRILSHHWDILSGDPIEQINCWLPVGPSHGTNTLQYVSWELSQRLLMDFASSVGFDRKALGSSRTRFFEYLCADPSLQDEVLADCRPLNMAYGEVALFDARLLHGTAENVERHTRISIDFRLLAVDAWEAQMVRFERGQLAPCYPWQEPRKGGFYDDRTAFQL